MENKTKKALKVVGAGLVAVSLGMAAGATLFPVEKEVRVPFPVPGPVQVIEKEVPGPVQVVTEYVTVTETKTDGRLEAVVRALYESDGDASGLVEDLDESEIAEIADRAVFEIDSRAIAEQAVLSGAKAELHRETVGGIKLDREDITRIKVEDDKGEIKLLSVDYDDKDADVLVTARFEHDDVKMEADFIVTIKDGKFDELTVDDIRLR